MDESNATELQRTYRTPTPQSRRVILGRAVADCQRSGKEAGWAAVGVPRSGTWRAGLAGQGLVVMKSFRFVDDDDSA